MTENPSHTRRWRLWPAALVMVVATVLLVLQWQRMRCAVVETAKQSMASGGDVLVLEPRLSQRRECWCEDREFVSMLAKSANASERPWQHLGLLMAAEVEAPACFEFVRARLGDWPDVWAGRDFSPPLHMLDPLLSYARTLSREHRVQLLPELSTCICRVLHHPNTDGNDYEYLLVLVRAGADFSRDAAAGTAPHACFHVGDAKELRKVFEAEGQPIDPVVESWLAKLP